MANIFEQERQKRVPLMAVMSKGDTAIPTETKKRRKPPCNPDPDAQVVALSPRTLLATNRYVCEVCDKGFKRDQNLQLHRRGHDLPWKLKQRSSTEAKKRVYVCPEITCAHHDPNRALGDLTGIKKHYLRKHGEKKWRCSKCSKRYAVQSDWKAHWKICGTKEYRCDCGTIFSRRDSFIAHRAYCEALNEENYRTNHGLLSMIENLHRQPQGMLSHSMQCLSSSNIDNRMSISGSDPNTNNSMKALSFNPLMQGSSNMLISNGNLRTSGLEQLSGNSSSRGMEMGSSFMSATALLQKAAEIGVKVSDESTSPALLRGLTGFSNTTRQNWTMPDTTNSYSNNYAPWLETAEVIPEAVNARLIPSSVGGSYVGVLNTLQMSSKRDTDDLGFRTTVPFPLGGESIDYNVRRDPEEDNAEKRNGRMTQDFLGLGASGSMSVTSAGNSNYNEDEMYSYHQMSNGPTIVGKNIWDY